MAYASLLSLSHTIDHISNTDYQSPALKQITRSLQKNIDFLLDFLDVISPKSNQKISGYEARIRDAAFGAEDLIESNTKQKIVNKWSQFIKEFAAISADLERLKIRKEIRTLQPTRCLPAVSSNSGSTNKRVIMEIDRYLTYITDLLIGPPSQIQMIAIFGKPGSGKTTLARTIYSYSAIASHFHTRAWVTISQEFNLQNVLEGLLRSIKDLNYQSQQESTKKLAKKLHESLKGKKYFIVVDDVWDFTAVLKVRRLLPNENNGSRILFTTRKNEVAEQANPCLYRHKMARRSLDDSWNLLEKMVFREERCPSELMAAGMSIAKYCRGLLLVLVLIGGLLYKAERTRDYWVYVAMNTFETFHHENIANFISFIYDQLPHHLRACFLYMGVLPEDYEIHRSKLIVLWVANRFIKSNKLKSLEEVAEEYLQDLVDRNLIMLREWTYSGKIKTCCIHDALRDFCLMKAKEEHINSDLEYLPEVNNNLRHVSILTDTIPKFEIAQNLALRVRSVTFFSRDSPSDIPFLTSFLFLRILDAITLSFDEFPVKLVELVTLRYIALAYCMKHKIPASISKLCKLEALIINPGKLGSIFNALVLPPEVWDMSQLRHLLFVRGFLPYPTEALNARNKVVLFENLRTLTNVVNFRWTKEVLLMMPNLKKLVISYEHDGRTEWSSYHFDNFVLLHHLEVLKCLFFGKTYMKFQDPLPVKFVFPQNLKRLILSGCRISWKDMTIVGLLPTLQALKLKFHAFEGSLWESNNGEFRQLKLLLIQLTDLEDWKADEMHFPSLERLTLNYCYNLVEIPSRIGKIPTLREINLCGCRKSLVTSAKVIQKEQMKLGNHGFQVVLKGGQGYRYF